MIDAFQIQPYEYTDYSQLDQADFMAMAEDERLRAIGELLMRNYPYEYPDWWYQFHKVLLDPNILSDPDAAPDLNDITTDFAQDYINTVNDILTSRLAEFIRGFPIPSYVGSSEKIKVHDMPINDHMLTAAVMQIYQRLVDIRKYMFRKARRGLINRKTGEERMLKMVVPIQNHVGTMMRCAIKFQVYICECHNLFQVRPLDFVWINGIDHRKAHILTGRHVEVSRPNGDSNVFLESSPMSTLELIEDMHDLIPN